MVWGSDLYLLVRVSSVDITEETLTLIHHDTAKLTVTVLPSGATYRDVTWISSNEDVATVDQSGNVTAAALGSALIIATVDGKSDTCAVTVSPKHVTSVTLSANSKTLMADGSFTLAVTVAPLNVTYTSVVWKSSDTDVATVDQIGNVKAIAAGSTTITATADGKSDTCVVTVASTHETYGQSETPASSATSVQTEDMPDTDDKSEQSVTISPNIIEEDDETSTVIVEINVSDLPQGTMSIKMPNGDIIEIGDADTIQIEMSEEDIDEMGTVSIIALNEEGDPLAMITMKVAPEVIAQRDTADAWSGIWSVLKWVLIGLAGVGLAIGTVYIILRNRKNA